MVRFRAALLFSLLLFAGATSVARGAVQAALPVPKSERDAVAEIERRAAAREFAVADSLARMLIARSEDGGRKRYPLADALDLRTSVLNAWGRPNDPEFAAAATRAVTVREAATMPDPSRHAAALRMVGIARLRRVEYAAADTAFARARAVLEAAPQRDLRAIAITLAWQAESQRVTRQLKLAEETANRAIAALAHDAPGDTAIAVQVHVTLGNVLAERGRVEESIQALEHALALEQSRAAPDSVQLGRICRFLGRAHSVAGNHDASEQWFTRSVGIHERVLGPNHTDVATTLYMLSFVQLEGGDPLAARRSAQRAVDIRARAFGPDHPQVAIALWQVGSSLRELGDIDGALANYRRSVAILRAANPPTLNDLATGLNNLGGCLIAAGQGAEARAALEEAAALRDRISGPGAGRSWWSLSRMGQALILEGRSAEAAALLDTVLASNLRHTPFDRADALWRRGTAAWASNDLPTTERCFDQAFTLLDSLSGTGSTRTLDALSARAAARWASGRRTDAFADADRAGQAAVDIIRSTARGLSEQEALAYEGSRVSGRDILLTLAADSVGVTAVTRGDVFDAVVRSRIAVLDELADESRALPRDDAALAPLVRELEESRVALARAMVTVLRDDSPPDSTVAAARSRREQAERALAERSNSFRAVSRRATASGSDVVAAMPAGSALVSYVRYEDPRRILDEDTPAQRNLTRLARYAALVVRAGQKTPVVIPLGDAASLETSLDAWAAALATPPAEATAPAEAARRRCDAIGKAVRGRIWDPLGKALANADPVFVVPDGALHRVNFAALPSAKDGAYLVERGPLIHRLTAERDLVPWDAPASGQHLLALGGVDFDRADGGASASEPLAVAGIRSTRSAIPDSLRVRFASLPQTALEVAEVGRIWRDAGLGEPIELTGAAASEGEFKRRAPGQRFLHLATHGFALGAPAASPAGTRGIGGVGGPTSTGPRRSAPLLPGLALAGANAPADTAAEDGFLTAEEITALDLSSVDWAVLSACETGRSDPGAVEAVQGLHRSFRRAGARTVVVSLWAVDDEATRTWMGHLYRARLLEKRSTANAVRDASRAMLAERRAKKQDLHPFHWAAFVASGDWR